MQASYPDIHAKDVDDFMVWPQSRFKRGCGLVNLGNTCFLNSVVQCLTHTPPLANFALSGLHGTSCRSPGFCALCGVESHVKAAFSATNGSALSPKSIVANLHHIGKQFRFGRQEDAHEFLRCLLDLLLKCSLPCNLDSKKTDILIQYSFVGRIFGGKLLSQVKCSRCQHESNTYDAFLDLSLELTGNSVRECMDHFTREEVLDVQNQYKCDKCRQRVRAVKRFAIESPPSVLTIQLKRFDFAGFSGGKISRRIAFDEKLDLTPFLTKTARPAFGRCMYDLYAVLVHLGASTNSGHYYAFVKGPTSAWYCMDDDRVQEVPLSQVLDASAYILFYTRLTKLQSKNAALPNPLGNTSSSNLGPKVGPKPPPIFTDRHSASDSEFIGPMPPPSKDPSGPKPRLSLPQVELSKPLLVGNATSSSTNHNARKEAVTSNGSASNHSNAIVANVNKTNLHSSNVKSNSSPTKATHPSQDLLHQSGPHHTIKLSTAIGPLPMAKPQDLIAGPKGTTAATGLVSAPAGAQNHSFRPSEPQSLGAPLVRDSSAGAIKFKIRSNQNAAPAQPAKTGPALKRKQCESTPSPPRKRPPAPEPDPALSSHEAIPRLKDFVREQLLGNLDWIASLRKLARDKLEEEGGIQAFVRNSSWTSASDPSSAADVAALENMLVTTLRKPGRASLPADIKSVSSAFLIKHRKLHPQCQPAPSPHAPSSPV